MLTRAINDFSEDSTAWLSFLTHLRQSEMYGGCFRYVHNLSVGGDDKYKPVQCLQRYSVSSVIQPTKQSFNHLIRLLRAQRETYNKSLWATEFRQLRLQCICFVWMLTSWQKVDQWKHTGKRLSLWNIGSYEKQHLKEVKNNACRKQWCKQDQIHKTKTKITRPRPRTHTGISGSKQRHFAGLNFK